MTTLPDLQELYVQVCQDREQLITWLVGILEGCEGCTEEARSFVERLKGEDG